MLTDALPFISRVVSYSLIVFAIAVFVVDIACIFTGRVYDTVSTKLRILDVKNGNIIAWLFLGLWLHLFIPINSISIGT